MNKFHTVPLPRQNEVRHTSSIRRPATALVISVMLHVLIIGALVLIPRPSTLQKITPPPPQFTLHYSDAEDILVKMSHNQPSDKATRSHQTLTQASHMIPTITISRLSPSLPAVSIFAIFMQNEKADSFTQSLSPSMEFSISPPSDALGPSRESSNTLEVSSELIAAHPLKHRPPVYPTLARNKGYEGTAIFIATINAAGTIENLQLSKTSGHAILDKSAKEALRHWRFTPATRNGITIDSKLRIPIIFRLG